MSEKQFPLDGFIHNRMQTLFKGHLTDFEMYEELRQLVFQTQDVSVAIMYATLGCEVGECDDVIDVLENQFSDIQTKMYDEELDKVYISALVQSWQLEKAQLILDTKYELYYQKGCNTFLLDSINDELSRQFEMLHQEEQKDKDELMSKIEQIKQLSYVQQQQIIPQLRLLEDDEFLVVAQQLLQSNHFHQLLKAYVLEMLVSKRFDMKLTLKFYGTMKSVDIATLNEIDSTLFMQQLNSTVSQYVSDSNDQLVIYQNAKLYLALSYPFEQELFDNIEQFVLAILHKHQTNDHANEWLERFEKLIQEMTI